MTEDQIRTLLKHKLGQNTLGQQIVIDELPIAKGKVRADLVRLSNNLECFEIKSQNDNLKRLERQAWHYNRTFSRVTLVAATKHIDDALPKIPDWWGVIEALSNGKLRNHRRAKKNPNQTKLALVDTLTKTEVVELLSQKSTMLGLKSKSINELKNTLVEKSTLRDLSFTASKILALRRSF